MSCLIFSFLVNLVNASEKMSGVEKRKTRLRKHLYWEYGMGIIGEGITHPHQLGGLGKRCEFTLLLYCSERIIQNFH